MVGYSEAELDDVQAKWGLHFPRDVIDCLREHRPLIDDPQCFNWVTADPEHIRERLAWPFESYWRSVERHGLWWPEWGERPVSKTAGTAGRPATIKMPAATPDAGQNTATSEPAKSNASPRRAVRK